MYIQNCLKLAVLSWGLLSPLLSLSQSPEGYFGTWAKMDAPSPFEKITILPKRANPNLVWVTFWQSCHTGLCPLPGQEAQVIGSPENNMLVFEAQVPDAGTSYPVIIYQGAFSKTLKVQLKQGRESLQLFVFQRSEGEAEEHPAYYSQAEPTQPERPLKTDEDPEPLFAGDQLFYESEPSSSPSMVSSPGNVVFPHCYQCAEYQLRIFSSESEFRVSPALNAQGRWECELPDLPIGNYELEVVWGDGFSQRGAPPYQKASLEIQGGQQGYITKVLQRK